MNPLRVALVVTERGPTLALAGELDHCTAPEVHEALQSVVLGSGQCLALDLGDLDFFDSTGVAVLMRARLLAHSADATLVLTRVPAQIARILRIVGLDDLLTTPAP